MVFLLKKAHIVVFVFFCVNLFSQERQDENTLSQLEIPIINEEVIIESSTRLKMDDGFFIGKKGCFTIKKGNTLTIDSKLNVFQNKQLFFGEGKVHFMPGSVKEIDVTWFGAIPNDGKSDDKAIQKAIDMAILSQGSSVVYIPPGEYNIDSPLLALRKKELKENEYAFFNLTIKGSQLPFNNPKKKGAVSIFKVRNEIPFALGIQGARGVHIEHIVFDGYIPVKFGVDDLIYKPSNELYPQKRFAPLSAIVIDPFSNEKPLNNEYYKGFNSFYNSKISSSKVHIESSVIQNFPTGVAISPNGKTQQGDTIAITFTRFSNLVNGLVICQTQSRNIVVDNCSFHRMKYAFNADEYGTKSGILPEVNNSKIADGVAWVYRVNGNISYGHFRNLYAEAIYGIGYSPLNKRPLHFDACVFSFRPKSNAAKKDYNPCVLKADNASFVGCAFTIGGGKKNIEPLLIDVKKATFINCYLDSDPVNIGNNLANKNITEYVNSSKRKVKLETSTWSDKQFSKEVNVALKKENGRYYISKKGNFNVGDFLFGNHVISYEPFKNHSVFTVLGEIVEIDKKYIYFKSELDLSEDQKIRVVIN